MSEKLYTVYRHYVAIRSDGTRDSYETVEQARHVPEAKAHRMEKRKGLYAGGAWTQQAVEEG